jgi:hypothetical protein
VKKKKLQKKLAKTKKRLATALSELKEIKAQNTAVLSAGAPASIGQETTEMAPELPVSGDELFETAAANGHSAGIN